MKNLEDQFDNDLIEILKNDTYPKYLSSGSRSTKKLIGVHSFLANYIDNFFDNKFYISYNNGGENKDKKTEKTVKGAIYSKVIDITATHDKEDVFCLGFKFPCSNYKQNAINYFECMSGETNNIQSADIPYCHILILPHKLPYKNKNGEILKEESITSEDIQKYINLLEQNNSCSPYAMLIKLVELDSTYQNIIGYKDLSTLFPKEQEDKLEILSSQNFLNKLYKLKSKVMKEDENG